MRPLIFGQEGGGAWAKFVASGTLLTRAGSVVEEYGSSRALATERTDVLVVGGGIPGAAAAYHLARAGLRTTLIESRPGGHGPVQNAAVLLAPPLLKTFGVLARQLGEDAARELWELGLRSIDGLSDLLTVRGFATRAELDRSGGHVVAERATVEQSVGAFHRLARAGLPVRWMGPTEAAERTGAPGFVGGYRIEGAGAVHPGVAAEALTHAARAAGATITRRPVRAISPCPDGFRAATEDGEVLASAVVYAGSAADDRFGLRAAAPLDAVDGDGFMTAPLGARLPGGFATEGKRRAWTQRPDGRLMVRGVRERGAGAPGRKTEVRAWFERSFPQLASVPVEAEWSGSWAMSPDRLPIVGALPGRSGEWITTGFDGGGLGLAFEAGRAVAHAIVGDEAVPGAALLDPGRFALA